MGSLFHLRVGHTSGCFVFFFVSVDIRGQERNNSEEAYFSHLVRKNCFTFCHLGHDNLFNPQLP